jgi:hypothetical protein
MAVSDNAAIGSLPLWSSEPEMDAYTPYASQAPAWTWSGFPETPSCTSNTVAWQYSEYDVNSNWPADAPEVDVDEFDSADTNLLWNPAQGPGAYTGVTGLSPSSGPGAGGTSVTITGTGFTGATAVDFGTTAATSFTVNSATSISAVSPAGTGTVNVTVTTPSDTSATSSADEFTYAPTVTGLSPSSGPGAGGTSVTITGTGFTGATAVDFGTTAATSFTVNSATSITAMSPAGTGTVNVTVTTPSGTSATSSADQFTYTSTAGGAYTALPPLRLLDTRATGQTLGPNSSLNLTVTGGSVPSSATAVALNVTVAATDGGQVTDASYLSVYPTGGTKPYVSNLNWTKGETVPNSVIVPVGTDGSITFYNHSGYTDIVVDLEGYFAPASSTAGAYVPLTPARICDTRPVQSGVVANQCNGNGTGTGTLAAGGSLNIQVTGEGLVPAGATGAILNVTVTNTTAASYLEAYPEGATQSTASNLNWTAGETVANRVLVDLSSSGEITVYNHAGSTDVVVDVSGYFTNGTAALPSNASLYYAITPTRITDTRAGSGYPNEGDTLGAGAVLPVQVTGEAGIPSDATAGVLNVTATDTTEASYFTVYPAGITMPTASDVNWSAGGVVPNLTVATLSSTGGIDVYNYVGSADLVIDAFGYFSLDIPNGSIRPTLPPSS